MVVHTLFVRNNAKKGYDNGVTILMNNAQKDKIQEFWHVHNGSSTKVSFFVQCTKMQLITLQNFNIQTCFS